MRISTQVVKIKAPPKIKTSTIKLKRYTPKRVKFTTKSEITLKTPTFNTLKTIPIKRRITPTKNLVELIRKAGSYKL